MSNDAHQSQCAGWAVSRSGCTTFVEVEVGTAARMNSSPHSAATHAAWVARVVRKPPVCCAFAGALIAGPPHVLPPTRCSFTGTITPGRAMWRRRKTWRPCRCAQVVLCHPRFSMWLCNLGCAACGFEAPRNPTALPQYGHGQIRHDNVGMQVRQSGGAMGPTSSAPFPWFRSPEQLFSFTSTLLAGQGQCAARGGHQLHFSPLLMPLELLITLRCLISASLYRPRAR